MTRPSVRMAGPLAPHVEGFHAHLIELGSTPLSAVKQVHLAAHLSRWLESQRLESHALTSQRLEQFLRARRRAGYVGWRSRHAVTPLLPYLRRLEVVPPPPAVVRSAAEQLVDDYGSFLLRERGLSANSLRLYCPVALRFLRELFPSGALDLAHLTAADVTHFVLSGRQRRPASPARLLVPALRSFLRFLYLRSATPVPLMTAVPGIASWRLAALPRPVEPEHVARLLHACDRRTAAGRRADAMFLLLARLGLRASEVAAIELDDVDWRRGEIVVRGKGGRQERLPLPADVGEALAAYLRDDRRRSACRAFFLRRFAPIGPITRHAVTHLVGLGGERAGRPAFGAHRLRHTAATEMLRRGASLSVIAQVLRHRSPESTAIYAKVDRRALRTVAPRWPGGAA
jgi:integrase/recombinase XerD